MLHIITPLYRYENLPKIYSSIPKYDDIVWHISKTSRREKLTYDFIKSDHRIKVYETDCEDNDLFVKRNIVFDSIKEGHFHLLDDDTVFYKPMYSVYKKYNNFIGMIIGKQLLKNMTIRLDENYPKYCYIDTGNVLCHSSVLSKVRWEYREGYGNDFVFWDNCFKIFGKKKTILMPKSISIYNKLNKKI
jgi:hypothetical protein